MTDPNTMTPDTLLAGLGDAVSLLPEIERFLIEWLAAEVEAAPPPSTLNAVDRIAWTLARLSQVQAADIAGALGHAMTLGAIQAGYPAAEAQPLTLATIHAIANAACAFAAEQRAAASAILH